MAINCLPAALFRLCRSSAEDSKIQNQVLCRKNYSVCSSGVLCAIPQSPGPWLILCACLLWLPAFPQPGADSIHFLFLCSVAQSIVTLKGLGEQDQRSQSSCLTKSLFSSFHAVCAPALKLCCSVKTFNTLSISVSGNGTLANEKCQGRNVKCHYLARIYTVLMHACMPRVHIDHWHQRQLRSSRYLTMFRIPQDIKCNI